MEIQDRLAVSIKHNSTYVQQWFPLGTVDVKRY